MNSSIKITPETVAAAFIESANAQRRYETAEEEYSRAIDGTLYGPFTDARNEAELSKLESAMTGAYEAAKQADAIARAYKSVCESQITNAMKRAIDANADTIAGLISSHKRTQNMIRNIVANALECDPCMLYISCRFGGLDVSYSSADVECSAHIYGDFSTYKLDTADNIRRFSRARDEYDAITPTKARKLAVDSVKALEKVEGYRRAYAAKCKAVADKYKVIGLSEKFHEAAKLEYIPSDPKHV